MEKIKKSKELLRIRVYSYNEKNKKFWKTYTVNHFVQEGEARSTIFRLINCYESGISAIHS